MSRHSAWMWGCAALEFAALVAPSPGAAAERPASGTDVIQSLDYATHDAGNLRTMVSNWGQIGSRPGSPGLGSTEPSLEWPPGSGVDYLWTAGLWIGAFADLESRVTTTSYAIEVRPGMLPSDRIYRSHEGAPGGRRAPSPQADDDGDGRVDEDPLNGRDDDGDGQVDEDFRAVSDQMFCGEFGDSDPAIRIANPTHVPLGVRVEQGTFVWADPRIDDILGVEYQVANVGDHRLDQVYCGVFADCDIGARTNSLAAEDDRAGFWEGFVHTDLGGPPRTVKVSIGYMFDTDGDGGQAAGYAGLVFLGATHPGGSVPDPAVRLRNFRMVSGRASFSSGGDPTNDTERLQVLDGTGPLPLPGPDPQTGLRPPQLAPRASDWRMLLSAGAVRFLDPGDAVRVAFAFVLGLGFEDMVANAARAVILYENGWRTEDPVPVALQDFEAAVAGGEVQLAWRLSREALAIAHRVRVQRALAAAGPFTEVAALAPAASMSWMDSAPNPGESLWYRIEVDLRGGGVWSSRPQHVDAGRDVPARTELEPVVVHPDGATEIRYRIATAGPVDLAVFDIRGRRVASLAGGDAVPGRYVQVWDGGAVRAGAVARGVYFVRLDAGGAAASRKLVRSRR